MKPIVKKVLALIAVVAAAASVVAGREQPSSPQARKSAPRPDPQVAVATDIDLSKLKARADEGVKADAFARRDFAAPPPAAEAAAQAPAKPAGPPPLPFKYAGRMSDGEKLEIFLEQGQEFIAVEPGQRVGPYRVDKVTDEQIVFTYLPLKAKQTLPL
jgi:hypothetical protein